ncbi:MAG TPA: cysteine desulfurase NifS, partial [Spirochaetia bacterium]|nr:cysteine desulfurase NifS [Spirochaetia bacterium]
SIEIEPLIHGAGQENGHRAGTENVVFSVALGKACEIAKKYAQNNEIKSLTDYFYNQLKSFFGKKIRLNGHYDLKLPNTLNVSFPEFHGYEIIEKLQDIAASTGSACHSGQTAMSPVLKAMGLTEKEGRGALRFSLGRYTTENEINYVLDKLKNIFDKSN